ncbi:MAG: 16S rRNA (adenine(1518)-N(6)/adenine(1519)-N(6))-dimethyltransferase RsmA [Pseudomonadota bacterium]
MDERPELIQAPAKKALGQHFLFDPDILKRTALAAGPVEGRTVIEVGPGPGGLTRALLDAGAARVIAVEADPRFASALKAWPEAHNGRLTVVGADARKVDFEAEVARLGEPNRPAMIIANLPYNVGTPLLVGWLKAGAWRGEMALMFQKEVAERICAEPGSPHYGRLAVLSQAVCETHVAFTLPPGAFRPPPKVDSAVAVLRPLPPETQFQDLAALERVTAAAFGQRRKMLRAGLKSLAKQEGLDVIEWIETAGLDPTSRPETVDQACFRALASTLGPTSGR